MSSQRIEPSKIRTPIQLLAAWLAGLVFVNGSFLGAAASLHVPYWASGALVIASIANVPIFLAAIFLLQTRFRPEMQEDEYYSQYLERTYSRDTARLEFVAKSASWAGEQARLGGHTRGHILLETLESSVALNDLLPHFQEIAAEFRRADIGFGTFGSTSSVRGPPENFVIAIGRGFDDLQLIQKILHITKHHGLTGVARSAQNVSSGKLLLGAYGYSSAQSYHGMSNATFEKLLAPSLTWQDLEKMVPER